MLSENIDTAVDLIEQVDMMSAQGAEKESIVKNNNKFFAILESYNSDVECYIMVRSKFGFAADDETQKLMETAVDSIKLIFDRKTTSRLDSLKRNTDNLNSQLKEQWKKFVESKNQKRLDNLAVLKQIAENKLEIGNIQNAIKKCSNWPITQDIADIYVKACDFADDMLHQMNFDENIESFLRKVSLKTATLADLTPSVFEWIKEEGLTEKIFISINR